MASFWRLWILALLVPSPASADSGAAFEAGVAIGVISTNEPKPDGGVVVDDMESDGALTVQLGVGYRTGSTRIGLRTKLGTGPLGFVGLDGQTQVSGPFWIGSTVGLGFAVLEMCGDCNPVIDAATGFAVEVRAGYLLREHTTVFVEGFSIPFARIHDESAQTESRFTIGLALGIGYRR